MSAKLPIGTKVRFNAHLDCGPTEDHPAFLYARRGEIGEIIGYNDQEGYWVKTNRNPPFGASDKEFEAITSHQTAESKLPPSTGNACRDAMAKNRGIHTNQ